MEGEKKKQEKRKERRKVKWMEQRKERGQTFLGVGDEGKKGGEKGRKDEEKCVNEGVMGQRRKRKKK